MNAKNPVMDLDMPLATGPTASSEPDPFVVGAVLCQRYRIQGQLDSVGHTLIFRVRDERWQTEAFESDLTIKTLRPELRDQSQWQQRLKREFEQTRQLRHPHIVRVHGLESQGKHAFLIMELLKGRSLGADLQARQALLPMEKVREILSACCRALHFAHTRGIVHADLRPENIFLLPSDSVRLMGFGSIPTRGGHILLTESESEAAYTSPQVVGSQRPDARDDVFSLACIAHELLCGKPMQREINGARVRCIADPCLPAGQREVLEAAFAWRREDRPDDIRFLLELLKPTDSHVNALAGTQQQTPEQRPAPTPPIADDAKLSADTTSTTSPPAIPEASQRRTETAVPPQAVTPSAPPVAVSKAARPLSDSRNLHPQDPGTSTSSPSTSPSPAATAGTASPRSKPAPATSKATPISTSAVSASRASHGRVASAPPLNPRLSGTPSNSADEHTVALRRWTAASVLVALGAVVWTIVDAQREKHDIARPAIPVHAATVIAAPADPSTSEKNPPQTSAKPALKAKPSPPTDETKAQSENKPVSRPVAAQEVAFMTPSVMVSTRATAAALTLNRSKGRSGRLRVDWRIEEGTAVAGRDFTGPSSGSIEFAHLQTVRSLYIPLNARSGKTGSRKFKVELTSSSEGVRIAPNHAVTVTIVDYG